MSAKLYERFISNLELKGYAKRSIGSYVKAMQQLQRFCNKPLGQIKQSDLREYWLACKRDYGWADSTLRISYSGIKLFFSTTLVRKWRLLDEVKFTSKKSVPTVLGIGAVKRIICALPTLQSKVFYLTMYTLGLRLQETVDLEVGDIDSERMTIHLRSVKRERDRVLPLSKITLRGLRAYYKTHQHARWIFPAIGHNQAHKSGQASKTVSKSAMQSVLRRTVVKLGIKKRVHPHIFRHSYATHLLEALVPIHHVQELLGHKSIQSTMVYLHVTTRAKTHSDELVRTIMHGVFSS